MAATPPARGARLSAQAAQPSPAAVASPCINICQMHADTGWCEGCLRTIDEIVGWGSLGDTARRQILAALPTRQGHWQTLVAAGSARAIRRRKIGPAT